MHRYEPFSGAHRIRDAPVFDRAGSTIPIFLEPKDPDSWRATPDLAAATQVDRPAANPAPPAPAPGQATPASRSPRPGPDGHTTEGYAATRAAAEDEPAADEGRTSTTKKA